MVLNVRGFPLARKMEADQELQNLIDRKRKLEHDSHELSFELIRLESLPKEQRAILAAGIHTVRAKIYSQQLEIEALGLRIEERQQQLTAPKSK